MIIGNNTLEDAIKFTGVDLSKFFADYVVFVQNHYPNMVNYYNGTTNSLNSATIASFNTLVADSERIIDTFSITFEKLDRLDYWNLLEFTDDIYTRMFTLKVISKWLRSSKYEGFNEDSLIIEYSTKDTDTPEVVAGLDRNDPQNEWVDIYHKNNVYETDYVAEKGGLLLKLGLRNLGDNTLDSVVDNMVGDKVYGKDMSMNFRYEDNDVFVETPRDTFKESVKVLANLRKGGIPEVPQLGITEELSIGNTMGLINMPFIEREVTESFGSDDTMREVEVKNVEFKGTAMSIEFQVRSFYDLMYNTTIELG